MVEGVTDDVSLLGNANPKSTLNAPLFLSLSLLPHSLLPHYGVPPVNVSEHGDFAARVLKYCSHSS